VVSSVTTRRAVARGLSASIKPASSSGLGAVERRAREGATAEHFARNVARGIVIVARGHFDHDEVGLVAVAPANRVESSMLYTDHVLYSPTVPFSRVRSRSLLAAVPRLAPCPA